MGIEQDIAFKVTSWFETGTANPYTTVSPNFDGQGISWGPHQHNLGQGTLQPLLKEIHEKYSATLDAAFVAVGDTNRAMRIQFLELLGVAISSKVVGGHGSTLEHVLITNSWNNNQANKTLTAETTPAVSPTSNKTETLTPTTTITVTPTATITVTPAPTITPEA